MTDTDYHRYAERCHSPGQLIVVESVKIGRCPSPANYNDTVPHVDGLLHKVKGGQYRRSGVCTLHHGGKKHRI